MIVAAHQPNFLPWLGFFDRMRQADLFVIVDHVQFERQNYQNRVLIKTDAGPKWITVPVQQRGREETILEKRICPGEGRHDWRRRLPRTLEQSYARAPHFKEFGARFLNLLAEPGESLAELNVRLIQEAMRALGIEKKIVRSSQLGITGLKSDMVLNLCKAVGAGVYLAGLGGSHEYLDLDAFKDAGIEVRWQRFEHPVYPQQPANAPFARGLSVFDLLVNCGPESADVLARGAAVASGGAAS
jgi:hypothetical protein